MTQEEYIAKQKANIDQALVSGKELLRASASLHKVCDTADKDATRNDEKLNYMRDSLQYFDFSSTAAELASMPDTLNTFKKHLIEIKIDNDKMLYEGGYRKDIDETISRIFLSHTLCKIKIIDKAVLDAVRDALAALDELKASL